MAEAKTHAKSKQNLFSFGTPDLPKEEEKVLLKGPPVVSKIQALDQYGNVIA